MVEEFSARTGNGAVLSLCGLDCLLARVSAATLAFLQLHELDMEIEGCEDGKGPPLRVQRRPLPLTCLGKGATSFPYKLECLLWAVMLEAGCTVDAQRALHAYANQVIAVVTDQGTESLVAEAPNVGLRSLLQDTASLLKSTPLNMEMLEDFPAEPAEPAEQLMAAAVARNFDQMKNTSLFPNALIIHGVKHICDNALKSILQQMQLCLCQASNFNFDFNSAKV